MPPLVLKGLWHSNEITTETKDLMEVNSSHFQVSIISYQMEAPYGKNLFRSSTKLQVNY
jgi:hypothetical protein